MVTILRIHLDVIVVGFQNRNRGQANLFDIWISRFPDLLLKTPDQGLDFPIFPHPLLGVAHDPTHRSASPHCQTLVLTEGLQELLPKCFAAKIPPPPKGRLQAHPVRKFISCLLGLVPVHAAFEPFEMSTTSSHRVSELKLGHPRNKFDTSNRLALGALAKYYCRESLVSLIQANTLCRILCLLSSVRRAFTRISTLANWPTWKSKPSSKEH